MRCFLLLWHFCCARCCCCWHFFLFRSWLSQTINQLHRYQKCFPLRDKHQNYWLKIVRGKWCKVKIANQQNQLISPFWAFIISKRLLIIGPIVTAGRLATVSEKNPECFWLNKTQPDTLYSSRLIRQSRCADLKEIKLIVITALKHSTNYLFRW